MAPPQKVVGTHNPSLEFRLNALVGAVNRLADLLDDRLTDLTDVLDDPSSGQDLKEILLTNTNMLERIEQKMATQEERLQAAIGKLETIQAGVDRIQDELEAVKANNPAIEDELAGVEAALEALASDVAAPAEEPTEEPTPTEGS